MSNGGVNFDPSAVDKLNKRLDLVLSAALESVKQIEALREETAQIRSRLMALEEFLPAMRQQFAGQIAGVGSLDLVLAPEKRTLDGGTHAG